MTAGEDEPQPVILDLFVIDLGLLHRVAQAPQRRRERRVERRPPAQPVDRLEASRRNEPRARIGRHALSGPAVDRRCERVLRGLLGEVEIAEEADERGQDAARVGPVNLVDPLAHLVLRGHYAPSMPVVSMIGRTSTDPWRADGIFAATWIASFRSRASIR